MKRKRDRQKGLFISAETRGNEKRMILLQNFLTKRPPSSSLRNRVGRDVNLKNLKGFENTLESWTWIRRRNGVPLSCCKLGYRPKYSV